MELLVSKSGYFQYYFGVLPMFITEENAKFQNSLYIKDGIFSPFKPTDSQVYRKGGGCYQSTEFQNSLIPISLGVNRRKEKKILQPYHMLISSRGCFFFLSNSISLLQDMKNLHFLKTNYTVYLNYSNIFQVPLYVKGSLFLPLKRLSCFICLKTSIT